MSSLVNIALEYAALGWKILPCKPGSKEPLTRHGVHDATNDEIEIRRWWARWPNANIAVACGKVSGIAVIDIDVKNGVNGFESLKDFPPLPKTVTQRTPSGGAHYFFKTDNPPANRVSFRPGIDIRSEGSYVLLAPSVLSTGRSYVWLPGCSPEEVNNVG